MLNFAFTEFYEVRLSRVLGRREGRPPRCAVPLGLQTFDGLLGPLWKEDRPLMDGSKEHPLMTAGLDIGDKYSYLCLINTENAEVIEEGRLCVPPQKP